MGLNLLELYWANWHYISNCTELLDLIWMWPWTLALLSKLTTWYQLLELVWMWPSWTLTLLNNLTIWQVDIKNYSELLTWVWMWPSWTTSLLNKWAWVTFLICVCRLCVFYLGLCPFLCLGHVTSLDLDPGISLYPCLFYMNPLSKWI